MGQSNKLKFQKLKFPSKNSHFIKTVLLSFTSWIVDANKNETPEDMESRNGIKWWIDWTWWKYKIVFDGLMDDGLY